MILEIEKDTAAGINDFANDRGANSCEELHPDLEHTYYSAQRSEEFACARGCLDIEGDD